MIVKFHNEEMPDGMEVEVGGILLVNNEDTEIDEEALERYENEHGESLESALSRNVHTPYYVPVEVEVEEVEDTQLEMDEEEGDD